MSMAPRRYLGSLYAQLRTALRTWAGEDDYERYLRRCAEGREPPLDRGRYFARRLEERYRSTSRCC